MGRDPQALRDKPEIPWYYVEFVNAFSHLSAARTYSLNRLSSDKSQYVLGPDPIDIQAIFRYNERVIKINDFDFIDIIQELDQIFINRAKK